MPSQARNHPQIVLKSPGEEGTGKGALFHHVLTSLLDTNHTYEV
jgi:hypothetical protein